MNYRFTNWAAEGLVGPMESPDSPARERVAVGYIVSTEVAADLARRFPPPGGRGLLRASAVRFYATPVIVDPAAPARQCEAIYCPVAWADRAGRIANAK